MEKYWIVTLRSTYQVATSEGFLWSPKLDRAGKRNAGYNNMNKAQVGDIVFTCVDQYIKDIGVIIQPCYSKITPAYPSFLKSWDVNTDGHALKVDWLHLKKNICLKDYENLIREIDSQPSPFENSDLFKLKQQYLIELSDDYAKFIFEKLSVENGVDDIRVELDKKLTQEIVNIDPNCIIGNTTRVGLIKIRIAQSKFTGNLLQIEKGCRVTNTLYDVGKIKDRYLISSHIKPWAECSNDERIDGNNGLFLAPHIDYLFDRYLLSFKKDGTMLISESIRKDAILQKWNITEKNVGAFTDKQDFYLENHRIKFYKKQEGI